MPSCATMQSAPSENRSYPDREMMEGEQPLSLSHFSHVLHNYRTIIVTALASVVLAYLIIALAVYLLSPAYRMTTQAFGLDFEGAGQGRYPNGSRFNTVEIINGPILARVWRGNHLGSYLTFGEFSRSIYVLESNRQYELIAAEYQAKLADPKLSPIDRERLQKEFELKTQSVTKNEYSLAFNHPAETRSIPEPLARKILLDILNAWADFAVNEQHVTSYQVSILSPDIVKVTPTEQNGVVAAIEILRGKANRVIDNLKLMENLPGARLARTSTDRISLEELRMRLDEIVRFELEPLLSAVLHSSLAGERVPAIRFLEDQLAFDQRQLDATERQAAATRDAIALYEQPAPAQRTANGTVSKSTGEQTKGSEAVTPQLNDTFLDRLITLSGRSADVQYRQKLVDDYRKAVEAAIPLQQAVAYDQQLLDTIRNAPAATTTRLDAATVQRQLDQIRTEVANLMGKTNELYQVISRNMTASTQLFTLNGPPTTRTIRTMSLSRLGLYGVLVFLLSIAAVIVACLIHNRVREEEAAEGYNTVATVSS